MVLGKIINSDDKWDKGHDIDEIIEGLIMYIDFTYVNSFKCLYIYGFPSKNSLFLFRIICSNDINFIFSLNVAFQL